MIKAYLTYKTTGKFMVLLLVLVVLFVLNLFFGSVLIPFSEVWLSMSGHITEGSNSLIVNQFRFPQAVTAVFSGAALAVAGLMLQTLFRNPLADPGILGISAGSGLGVSLMLFFGGTMANQTWISHFGLSFAAFAGALTVLFFIILISRRLSNVMSLLIAGLMIAYLAGALTGLVKYFSRKEEIYAFALWGLGSFSEVGNSRLPLFTATISSGLMASILIIKPLNMMLLGDRYAESLGLNIQRTTFFIVLITGFLTAVVTAYAGPVAFIGLAVPHLARAIFHTADHRQILPASILLGAALALFCNLLSRLPGFDGSLPINSLTSLIGAPIVIWFLFRNQSYTDTE